MQIFELHFNPKLKEDRTFDTFIFEPENAAEKKLGNLYMAGEIKNALPKQSKNLLGEIAKTIKKNYYSISSSSAEKALSGSLKKTNQFLDQEIKKENVNWLGNLSFAAFSLKDNDLTFTKSGDIKILLIRRGKITDIGKNLNLEGVDPYPLKIFFNIATGKLAEGDILLVLTSEIFNFFKEKGILTKIAGTSDIDSKKIKQIIPSSLFNKGDGLKVAGFSLVALLQKKGSKNPLSILFERKPEKSRKFLAPISIIVKPLKSAIKKVKKIKLKSSKKISLPKIKSPFISLEKFKKESSLKKKLFPVALFVVLLLMGFLIFKQAEDKKERDVKISLREAEEKVTQAEDFLIIKEQEKANQLFIEAYKQITELEQKETSLLPSIKSLKETIERHLQKLNNWQAIESPEIFIDLKTKNLGFLPEKISVSLNNLYAWLPYSSNISKISTKNKTIEEINLEKRIKSTNNNSGVFLMFTEDPASISYIKKGLPESKEINSPETEFSLDLFCSYLFNLYFLDKNTCDIIKYSYQGSFTWSNWKIWHKNSEKICQNPKSMSIDGSIWVLNQDNTITRYYTGEFAEKIELNIFPLAESITQIKTRPNTPYLYFLDPFNKRVVITEKNGKIFKQFFSEKFNNLKDISVSENGKTIYLLNDLTIYRIQI